LHCGYGNIFIGRIKQVHRFSEGEPKIKSFYPTDKFLERGEMRDFGYIKDFLNSFHISDIFNEFPVVLVSVILEENQSKELILSIDLLRVFTGTGGYSC